MKRIVTSNIRIKSSAERIIAALVHFEDLNQWWGVASSYIQKRDGGLFTLTWEKSDKGFKYIQTGRINLLNKRSHLYLEDVLYLNPNIPILGPFSIKFDVESSDTYSVLKVTQAGFEKGDIWDDYYEGVLDGWSKALGALKIYLENRI